MLKMGFLTLGSDSWKCGYKKGIEGQRKIQTNEMHNCKELNYGGVPGESPCSS